MKGKNNRSFDNSNGSSSDTEIDFSELDQSVQNALKSLKIDKEDETIEKLVVACLEHLKTEGKVDKRDLKMNIYLEFLEGPTEENFKEILNEIENPSKKELWEISKNYLEKLGKKTDRIETPRDKEHSFYIWR